MAKPKTSRSSENPSSVVKRTSNTGTTFKPVAPSAGSGGGKNWLVWVVVLVVLIAIAAWAFTQFSNTAGGLLGGGSIATPSGATEWKNDFEKLGATHVNISTQGKTTTIAFALPTDPQAALQDKALLASLALKVNGLPDDQILVIEPEGMKSYQTTGANAKKLLQTAIASGGNISQDQMAALVQQLPAN